MRALTPLFASIMLSCVALMASPASAQAQSANEALAAQAEHAFQQGVESRTRPLQAQRFFAEAADRYLELHERGVRAPGLYLNLGNAAYLADRLPDALWAYQLGLKLNPNDAHLREQREIARARVLYPASEQGHPESETWPAWLYRPSPDAFAVGFGVFYLLTWGLGTLAFLSRRPKFFLLTALALLAAFAAGGGYCLVNEEAEADRVTRLVIIRENTPFYRGNGRNYPPHPDVPSLPRGLEARLLHQRGGWLQIRLSTGEVGWIPHSQTRIVEP